MVLPLVWALVGTAAATILNDIVQQLRLSNCRDKDVKILVPIRKIEELEGNYETITCEGWVGTIRSEFHVACGHWDVLKDKLSDSEKRLGKFNLMDYFHELVLPPSTKKRNAWDSQEKKGNIGLVTYQNGINNKPIDFEKKSDWILENLPERPLCIGLFNPSHGKSLPGPLGAAPDLYRMSEEKVYHTDTVATTWSMFRTFAKLLPKDPRFFWLHIAHSEGTLLANAALSNVLTPPEEQKFFKEHLHILAYGAVMPIPNRLVRTALNSYSKKDITLGRYGKDFLSNRMHYNIKVVDCQTASPPLIEGDHDFLGTTYRNKLKADLTEIRKEYHINEK